MPLFVDLSTKTAAMPNRSILYIAGAALLLVFVSSKASASNNTASTAGNFNLNGLTNDPTDLSYLQALYAELQNRGLTNQQILYMLSQLLFESGILTSVANYHLIQQNNFAGLTTTSGDYAAYNSIGDFVTAYIGFLTKGADPLAATSLTDFNNRLVQNHYYQEDPTIYYNGLLQYYNELIQNAQ